MAGAGMMSFVHVVDGEVRDEADHVPSSAHLLAHPQSWVVGLPTLSVDVQQATGWFEVADAERPADTAAKTWDRTVQLVDGKPVVVWVERDKTPAEVAVETRAANRKALLDPTSIQAWLTTTNTFLANAAPTTADVLAQVRRNAQALNWLVRVLAAELDPSLLDDVTDV